MKKKYVIITVITILLVISVTMGITYALWSQTHVQESDNVVTIGCFTTQYTDNAKAINLANTFPITDEQGMNSEAYEFTITNNCSIYATYGVNFEVDATSTLSAEYVKAVLDTNTPQLLNSYGSGNVVTEGNTAYQMITGGLAEGESATYSLRLWLDENASQESVENTSLTGKIVVTASATETPTYCELYPDYATCQIEGMLASNPDQLIADDPDGNVRFYGATPNNYVDFNGEKWRIIGTFNVVNPDTGATETRLKIMRDESIGNYSWDSSASGVNNGWGVNEWSQADIMTTLNSGAYWNRTSGTCYSDRNDATTTCDFSSNGLTSEAKSLISKARWNTGTLTGDFSNTEWREKQLVYQFYNGERSNGAGNQCSSGGTYCNDTVSRTTIWDGYVGLIYPSDYIYATGGGSITDRNNCLNYQSYKWNDEIHKENCAEKSWIFNGAYQWTMTSTPHSSSAYSSFNIGDSGNVGGGGNFASRIIRPTVYLKFDVKITGGIGISTDPFQISL